MSQKNLIIEVIEGAENKRYFILRELPTAQGTAPVTLLVSDDPEEVAQFLNSFKI